jgi:hypothetical protein
VQRLAAPFTMDFPDIEAETARGRSVDVEYAHIVVDDQQHGGYRIEYLPLASKLLSMIHLL